MTQIQIAFTIGWSAIQYSTGTDFTRHYLNQIQVIHPALVSQIWSGGNTLASMTATILPW